ncbi:MAG: hypothetical protein ACRCRZ_00390 [Metamycoplasmataceae bacterium]
MIFIKKIFLTTLTIGTIAVPTTFLISCSSSEIDQKLIDDISENFTSVSYKGKDDTYASSIFNELTFDNFFILNKIPTLEDKNMKIIFTNISSNDEEGTLKIVFGFLKNNKIFLPSKKPLLDEITNEEIKDKDGNSIMLEQNIIKISGFKKNDSIELEEFNNAYKTINDGLNNFIKLTPEGIEKLNNAENKDLVFNFVNSSANNYITNYLDVNLPLNFSFSDFNFLGIDLVSKELIFEFLIKNNTTNIVKGTNQNYPNITKKINNISFKFN